MLRHYKGEMQPSALARLSDAPTTVEKTSGSKFELEL
jgi:hypothetical protein